MNSFKLSLVELTKLIKDNAPDHLVGVEETSYLELREKTYATTTTSEAGKFKSQIELVKDITSISNSGGGLIFIGLHCEKNPSINVEFAKEITGISETEINMQSWQNILMEWVVPQFSPSYLSYGFIGDQKKVFWILIPDAKSIASYPFIIIKDQFSPKEGLNIKGRVVSLYERSGAENILLKGERIQKFIFDGLNKTDLRNEDLKYNSLSEMIRALTLKVDDLSSRIINANNDSEEKKAKSFNEMESRMINYGSLLIGGDSGYFYIYAIPREKIEIADFWETGEKNLYGLINKPPKLREMGWDLSVASTEYPYAKGDAWESTNGDRKIVRVTRTGEIFTAGSLEGFLDWGIEKYSPVELKEGLRPKKLINALSLTEYIDIFFHFFTLFRKVYGNNSEYEIRFGFVYPDNIEIVLHQPSIGASFAKTSKPPSKSHWKMELGRGDEPFPDRIAARALIEINASFGWPGEPYGYIAKDEFGYKVDEDYYRKIK